MTTPLTVAYATDETPVEQMVYARFDEDIPCLVNHKGSILLMGEEIEGDIGFLIRALPFAAENGYVFEREERFQESYPARIGSWLNVCVKWHGDRPSHSYMLFYVHLHDPTTYVFADVYHAEVHAEICLHGEHVEGELLSTEKESSAYLFDALESLAVRVYLSRP